MATDPWQLLAASMVFAGDVIFSAAWLPACPEDESPIYEGVLGRYMELEFRNV